jgi:hypothetical protein
MIRVYREILFHNLELKDIRVLFEHLPCINTNTGSVQVVCGTYHGCKAFQYRLVDMHTFVRLLNVHVSVIVEDGFRPLDIKRYYLPYHGRNQEQPDDHYQPVNLAGIVCEVKSHACL